MLTAESVVALNDILSACATSADLHAWVADHADGEALREHAAGAAASRRQAIERLTEDMRAHEALPRVPDPESAGFRAVMAGAKAVIAGAVAEKQRAVTVDALKDVERELARDLTALDASALPDSTSTVLEQIATDVERSLSALETV